MIYKIKDIAFLNILIGNIEQLEDGKICSRKE